MRQKRIGVVSSSTAPSPTVPNTAIPSPTLECEKMTQKLKSSKLNVYMTGQVPQSIEYAFGDKCKALRNGKTVRHSGQKKAEKGKKRKNDKLVINRANTDYNTDYETDTDK